MDQQSTLVPQSGANQPLLSGTPSSPSAAAPVLRPAIPDYELLCRIGGGAYGEVWLARSKATGVLRAAKIVWRHRFENERRFQREFEGIQKFERITREHSSQLALFHIGRNDAEGYFYYVMELADDLRDGSNGVMESRSAGDKPESWTRSSCPLIGDCSRWP
jgi:hypothetical protein